MRTFAHVVLATMVVALITATPIIFLTGQL